MFSMEAHWWEIVLRVGVLYVALLIGLRLSGKRELGQITPMDLLTIILLSETVSPALTADDTSIPGALIAAATLIGGSFLVGFATYRWRWFERLSEGKPSILIRNGRVDRRVMRAERISQQELDAALHKNNIADASDVALGVVETSGDMTFVEKHESGRQ